MTTRLLLLLGSISGFRSSSLVSPLEAVSSAQLDENNKEHQCALPSISINGSQLRDLDKLSTVTSVVFNVEKEGRELKCRLECRDNVWKGPFCEGHKLKYGCSLTYISPDLDVFHDHTPIQQVQGSLHFFHGSTLRFRCKNELKHLSGSSIISCQNSEWTSGLPTCTHTSTIESYSESLPPSLEWTVLNDQLSRGREGELIIYAGSILHIDCIYDRRQGMPQWSWSHNFRDYPTGWLITEAGRNWKFRLSIVYAKLQDSGSFNCTTPRGQQNSLVVRVTSTLCPTLQLEDNQRLSTENRHIGAEVQVECPTGFSTRDTATIICRDDGTWSANLPSCVPVTCPPLELSSSHLRVLRLNNTYLGEAEFDCPFGYKISGDKVIWCNQERGWSAEVPKCQEITCKVPDPPENGQILDEREVGGAYYVGATVQTMCHSGFTLVGEPITRCSQHGTWTEPTPHCIASCRYPGAPQHGSVYPLKFSYSVGEKVRVACDTEFVVLGKETMECLDSGEWNLPLPRCETYL